MQYVIRRKQNIKDQIIRRNVSLIINCSLLISTIVINQNHPFLNNAIVLIHYWHTNTQKMCIFVQFVYLSRICLQVHAFYFQGPYLQRIRKTALQNWLSNTPFTKSTRIKPSCRTHLSFMTYNTFPEMTASTPAKRVSCIVYRYNLFGRKINTCGNISLFFWKLLDWILKY